MFEDNISDNSIKVAAAISAMGKGYTHKARRFLILLTNKNKRAERLLRMIEADQLSLREVLDMF